MASSLTCWVLAAGLSEKGRFLSVLALSRQIACEVRDVIRHSAGVIPICLIISHFLKGVHGNAQPGPFRRGGGGFQALPRSVPARIREPGCHLEGKGSTPPWTVGSLGRWPPPQPALLREAFALGNIGRGKRSRFVLFYFFLTKEQTRGLDAPGQHADRR